MFKIPPRAIIYFALLGVGAMIASTHSQALGVGVMVLSLGIAIYDAFKSPHVDKTRPKESLLQRAKVWKLMAFFTIVMIVGFMFTLTTDKTWAKLLTGTLSIIFVIDTIIFKKDGI